MRIGHVDLALHFSLACERLVNLDDHLRDEEEMLMDD